MEYKTTHLVCFSPTHSSHTIANAVARGTGITQVKEIDLTYKMPDRIVCVENSLAIIAVPVYAGRVASTALERLKRIEGKQTPVILVVLYGNRDYEDALLELKDWAIAAGFVPLAGGAFIGEHSYSRPDKPIAANRPDKNDQQIAFNFGRDAVQRLTGMFSLDAYPMLDVKGNFPYKESKPKTPEAPVTVDELCMQCGHCVEICPVQAITLQGRIMSDKELCIKCCACVKQCPGEARVFDTPYTDMLFTHFSARREPELFL